MRPVIEILVGVGAVAAPGFLAVYLATGADLRRPMSRWIVLLNAVCALALGQTAIRILFGVSHEIVSLIAVILIDLMLLWQFYMLWQIRKQTMGVAERLRTKDSDADLH